MRISVVIPSLNDAEMLVVCLRALAAQSRLPDEVIVVDNGSTDSTAEVARAAGARVVAEPLRGTMPATAAGLDAATGDVIGRLDADSVPPTDWVERIEAAFTRDPGLAAVTGPGDFYGSSRALHWIGKNVYIGGYFWFMKLLLGHPPLFGSNLALSRQAWQRLRLTVHRELRELHDDLDLAYHLEPDMRVLYDATLRVRVSARPFGSWSGLGRRLWWAYTTIRLHSGRRAADRPEGLQARA